ncbi:unnamed protein product [Polarella glacialis]|uniref:Uncharacterized protein n=1 Tax=Polarella glacialis TaxID=89957 RepID=A0A813F2Q6_POLGL|nr:unnamed protein product [Polarella glacialis]CAE8737730.1 unnamed protein product [Polarella glacialis]|eukprot:CAMPEP_0115080436 /NCGR_PEP_ID=MMETSP0227-20121206/18676_1 /TAXON_ID=89957 /ORGANISM="Polarella glacialis, Strain CCMP 1383" /LENGTH=175 /DNA_ID=CAMNT_0002468077 /DNA_START=164 /DNA_END=691 /DNA_ORIENTATION=+
MSLMRAAALGRARLAGASRLPVVAGSRNSSFIPSTSEEWEAAGYEVSKKNGAPKIPSPWNRWFPYEPVPFSPKLGPYKVTVEKDRVYHWCSCGEACTQPFCDNVGCKDTKFKPVAYIPRQTETVSFCGSKHSPSKPLFNGTCWIVWADVNTLPAAGILFGGSFVFGAALTWMMHP